MDLVFTSIDRDHWRPVGDQTNGTRRVGPEKHAAFCPACRKNVSFALRGQARAVSIAAPIRINLSSLNAGVNTIRPADGTAVGTVSPA